MAVTQNERELKIQSIQGSITAIATLNKEDKKIKIKDPNGLDFKIEEYSEARLDDLIAVFTDIKAKAATEFA
jgi:hypothetical protein